MDKKHRRQQKITQIITESEISNQFELQAELRQASEEVTQATLSRDLFELGIVKVPGIQKMYRYAFPQSKIQNTTQKWDQLALLFKNFVIGYESAGNLLVVKTMPGNASGVAQAIDSLNLEGTLGSIAGDDTILIIARTAEDVEKIGENFDNL
ncbi:arginine repressor [candidate division KSB1 bacterium]|nr:arginine repressor [candidate division KSB1 bacterium]